MHQLPWVWSPNACIFLHRQDRLPTGRRRFTPRSAQICLMNCDKLVLKCIMVIPPETASKAKMMMLLIPLTLHYKRRLACPADPYSNHPGTISQSISEDCTGSNGWVPGTAMTCPAGYIISSITSATFGRPSGSGTQNSGSTAVCYGDGPTLSNGNSNCYFENVTSMAASQCIGQQACSPNFQVDKHMCFHMSGDRCS